MHNLIADIVIQTIDNTGFTVLQANTVAITSLPVLHVRQYNMTDSIAHIDRQYSPYV